MLSLFENKRIMVVVPHEDDEINIAGSLLCQLNKRKTVCDVVFVTNGDAFLSASRRQKEAEKSLHCLGIKKENIIFLGYPDVSTIKKGCVYLTDESGVFVSEAGHEHTYGGRGREEYIFRKKHIHHKYSRDNYLKDLKDVILEKRPDYIITNDMDDHPNHLELSVMMEEVLYEILINEQYYYPLLMKTYAYELAFYAIDDYSIYNLKETLSQNKGSNSTLRWEKRLRLPVPKEARTKLLAANIIYKTMWRHHSQTGYVFSSRIANSDKVYWIRRTDSKTYVAKFFASSGNTEFLNDYRFFCLDKDLKINKLKLWTPDRNDKEKKFRMVFQTPIDVKRIAIYENMCQEENILCGKISFNNEYSFVIANIQHDGSATIIDVDIQHGVEWIEFQILDYVGDNAGITEIEVYEPYVRDLWFLKICVNDNYAYKYYTSDSNVQFTIIAYDIYGDIMPFSKEKIHLVYNDGHADKEISDFLELNQIRKRKIVIKAYCEECSQALDEIIIIKRNISSNLNLFYQYLNSIINYFYIIIEWLINEIYRIPILFKKLLDFRKGKND